MEREGPDKQKQAPITGRQTLGRVLGSVSSSPGTCHSGSGRRKHGWHGMVGPEGGAAEQ